MPIFEDQPQDGYIPQEQPYLPPSPYYQPSFSMGQEVHLFRLNNQEIIEQIEHQLRGEILENKKWIKKYTPWANEEGISKIMSILTSCGLNKNITLGNLEREEIYGRCRMIWQKLAYMMSVNYHKYGIERSSRSMLIQMIIQPIHSALSRSEFGREAKQLSTTTQHLEHTVREDKLRNPSIFNPFGGIRKVK